MMRFGLRFSAPLLVLAVASCGDAAGDPITQDNGTDSGSHGSDASRDALADSARNNVDSGDDDDAGRGSDASGDAMATLDGSNGGDGGDSGGGVNLPRLVVASSDHVSLWNDASAIAADRAQDASITAGLTGGISSVGIAGHRLFVARKPTGGAAAIVAFDNADVMDATATPAATINRTGDALSFLRSDSANHLWAGDSNGISMFLGASALTNASAPAALFTHPFHQIPACAFEPTSGRLFAGQISGAGVLAWNSVAAKNGSPTNDFKLADGAYWGMTIAGNRLYAVGTHAGNTSNGVAIWNGADNLTATTPPSVTLTNGYPFQIFIPDVAVRDDVLAVAARDADKVTIYKTASAISSDQAPDAVLTNAQMKAPSRVVFGPGERLYVLDRDGVLIFRDVKTAPTFVTKITSGISAPVDIALIE